MEETNRENNDLEQGANAALNTKMLGNEAKNIGEKAKQAFGDSKPPDTDRANQKPFNAPNEQKSHTASASAPEKEKGKDGKEKKSDSDKRANTTGKDTSKNPEKSTDGKGIQTRSSASDTAGRASSQAAKEAAKAVGRSAAAASTGGASEAAAIASVQTMCFIMGSECFKRRYVAATPRCHRLLLRLRRVKGYRGGCLVRFYSANLSIYLYDGPTITSPCAKYATKHSLSGSRFLFNPSRASGFYPPWCGRLGAL